MVEADSFAFGCILRTGCCMVRCIHPVGDHNPGQSLDHNLLGHTVGILHTAAAAVVGCNIDCIVAENTHIAGMVVLVERTVLRAGKYLPRQLRHAFVRPGFPDSAD